MLEIDDLDGVAAWLAMSAPRPPAAFQALDLRHVDDFRPDAVDGCLFLSCELSAAQAGMLTESGALVIRDDHDRPYTSHRATLYTADELYAGFDPDRPDGYDATFDAIVYRHWERTGRQHPDRIDESLARRLHDHSITDALEEVLVGRAPVAVMGGHRLERAASGYAAVARMSRALTLDGFLMMSGGGPGAMEATHLGAWLAHFADGDLERAIEVLAPRPPTAIAGREYADADWLHRAFEVRNRWAVEAPRYRSIGIPTWAYGHEPPAAFATDIAKYFANSVREEGLLAVATHGVIFTPGSAGTVQEIFQDTTQNHYASYGPPSPMVLFGARYWTEQLPVWPLLEALAERHDYRDLIVLTDDEDEALAAIRDHRR